jgi:hypothetical protein
MDGGGVLGGLPPEALAAALQGHNHAEDHGQDGDQKRLTSYGDPGTTHRDLV